MKSDEEFYEAVVNEIEREGLRKGLWGKAFAKARGVENVAKAYYIEWRVEQFKTEMAAQVAYAADVARKQAEFDNEQERLREKAELERQSAVQYPTFVRLARRLSSFGFAQDAIEEQLEIRGLPKDLAVRAAREASNGWSRV